MSAFTIAPASTPDDFATVKQLFEVYTQSLGIDLAYQDISTELSTIPGKYAKPAGILLLARTQDGTPIGCVGLRPLFESGVCEMKRLYVTPAGRGTGVGRALAEAVVKEAQRTGYRAMRLDTLTDMRSARALYASLGFEPIDAYYDTPMTDVVFLEKQL